MAITNGSNVAAADYRKFVYKWLDIPNVNPGEFIAFVAKFILGTATASQVIWGTATVIHSWE